MCGIFGILSSNKLEKKIFYNLANHSRQRGKDSSGFFYSHSNELKIDRFDQDIKFNFKSIYKKMDNFCIAHSRLITNSSNDNQPINNNEIILFHNGIIVNDDEVMNKFRLKSNLKVDSRAILCLFDYFLTNGNSIETSIKEIFNNCEGTFSCIIVLPKHNKVILFSNCGSLFYTFKDKSLIFASEKFPLKKIKLKEIKQIKNDFFIYDYNFLEKNINTFDIKKKRVNLIQTFKNLEEEKKNLIFEIHNLRRCNKCILPETMPFIKFDEAGICNYCKNYKVKNTHYDKNKLLNKLEKLKLNHNYKHCIMPFSGGRDSSFALYLAVKEFNLKPITYTYDWGMVTDLARRNISRMCSILNIENIIVADNLPYKRLLIKKNVLAWLKKPKLGMVNIFTSGDKHFFKHILDIKKQTGISIDLWGTNPLEVTFFKSGFLGIKPIFEEKFVYNTGFKRQLNYHSKRFKEFLHNPSYFNMSILDNISGEYFRSIKKKTNHFQIYDYWKWNEKEVDETLDKFGWEKAIDTKSTWRIGDGAAAFYNYIYYTMAGFTEHDTFRSNQIREGDIDRQTALDMVHEENKPRYKNIRWFLDIINVDYKSTIKIINSNKLNLN